jgi:signal transduction histidine kinase
LHESRLELLQRVGVLDTPAEEAFDHLTTLVARLLSVPVALASFVDRDRQFFKSCFGQIAEPWMSARETPLSHSFCRHVVEQSEPLVVEDARSHPLVRDNLAIPDLGVIAYAGMPIQTPDGAVLGSLCAVDIKPRQWTTEELSSLALLAQSINTEIALRLQLHRQREIQVELEVAKAAAEEASRAKGDLLANVSHELRTPLSTVIGYADLLDDARLDGEQRAALATLRQSATSLLSLVDQLLEFVSLEAEGWEEDPSPFSTGDLFGSTVDSCESAFSAKGLTLVVNVAQDVPPTIVGDGGRIRRVFASLLSNALKFTDNGGVEVEVDVVDAAHKQDHLRVRVRDTGVGIAPDRLDAVFAPFVKHGGSTSEGVGGIGMGLALARRQATRMGGGIEVESTLGVGSTFTFWVPLGRG